MKVECFLQFYGSFGTKDLSDMDFLEGRVYGGWVSSIQIFPLFSHGIHPNITFKIPTLKFKIVTVEITGIHLSALNRQHQKNHQLNSVFHHQNKNYR
jgi:hypothetical protein